MENNVEKKEQTMSALKEKLKAQHEEWKTLSQAVEQTITKISLLEENIKFLNYKLIEVNNAEECLKNVIASLSSDTKERKQLIQEETDKHTESELLFDKLVSKMAKEISTAYEKYDRHLILEEFKKSMEENKLTLVELNDVKALVQQKLKQYGSRTANVQSEEMLKTFNELISFKKNEFDAISGQNRRCEEEISALRFEQLSLHQDVSDFTDKINKLENYES